jgi:hypothetical protein
VDGRCFAYFMTDESEQTINNFWFNCSAPTQAEALANLRGWLAPFHVQIVEGSTETEATIPSARIGAGVYPGNDQQWLQNSSFNDPELPPN